MSLHATNTSVEPGTHNMDDHRNPPTSPQPGSTAPATAGGFRAAKRIHQSLLAGVEKKALIWMAQRAPRWLNSDHLTLLGLLAMFGAGAAYWVSRWDPRWLWVASLGIVFNWLGDSLDGTLAR